MPTCCECGVTIQKWRTGEHRTEQGMMCNECFYDKLGEIIEAHPIGSPPL